MHFNAVVFDFNGTLFWDTAEHNRAWDLFLQRHRIRLSDDEKNRIIHGRNNQNILADLFDALLSPDQVMEYTREKEAIYRQICLDRGLELARGAAALLDFLKKLEIPFTIATASEVENVDFYFEHLGLSQWFDRSLVVCNDGSLRSKPDPQIFLRALDKLGRTAAETLAFEDSYAGIQAARNAGFGGIIIVDSFHADYSEFPYQVIRDFNQVERGMFHEVS